eukprot:snap_masked-scaffold_1-processed-gene-27.34-mRNA-1 protein AED:1.00 eAED:1.00 QI:0/0/0/0/1/1/3/0/2184
MKLFLWLLLLTSLQVKSDTITDFLDDKVFGANPGPCPTEAEKCSVDLDVSGFPQSIREINICLIEILGSGVFCEDIEDLVQGGTVEVWEMTCSNIGYEEVSISTELEAANLLGTEVTVDNFVQNCQGVFNLIDVTLALTITVFFIDIPVTIVLNGQGDFSTDPGNSGIQLEFAFDLSTGASFEVDVPDEINIPVDECELEVGLGLDIDVPGGVFSGLDVQITAGAFGIDIVSPDALTNLIISLIESVVGGIICEVISEGAFLEDGTPGILNELIDEAREVLDENNNGVAGDIVSLEEDIIDNPSSFGTLTTTELENSLNYDESEVFNLISVTLNDWLGSSDGESLVINQAVELLFEDGGFLFDFIEQESDLSVHLPLTAADVVATLNFVELQNLNTISSFTLLENTVGGTDLQYGLLNDLVLDSLVLSVGASARLLPGEWVTESSCGALTYPGSIEDSCTTDEEELDVVFSLDVTGVTVGLDFLSFFNIEEIDDLLLGQLLNRDFAAEGITAVEKIIQCISPAIYGVSFTSLFASLEEIDGTDIQLTFINDEELEGLVAGFVNLIITAFQSILTEDLPGILEGPVKEVLNEYFQAQIVEGETFCAEYTGSVPQEDLYLQYDSFIFSALFSTVNRVLGNAGAGTSADINDLIQTLLEFLESEEQFPLQSAGEDGNWVIKDEFNPLLTAEAFRGTGAAFPISSGNANIVIQDFLINNFDTISGLFLENVGSDGVHVNFAFSAEEPDEMTFGFTTLVTVDSIGLAEEFQLLLKLNRVEIDASFDQLLVNVDEFFRTSISQLGHVVCILGFVDTLSALSSSFTFDEVDFDLNILSTGGAAANSRLPQSLSELRDSLDEPTGVVLTSMVSTIFDNSLEQVILYATSLVEENDITPDNCLEIEAEQPLDGVLDVVLGVSIDNITETIERCIAEPEDVPTASELRTSFQNNVGSGVDLVDLSTTFGILDAFYENINAAGLTRQLLVSLANSTGDQISDLLILEEDESVSFMLPLDQPNFILELLGFREGFSFSNDRIIPNMDISFKRLYVRNIDNALDYIAPFQVLNTLVAQTQVALGDNVALSSVLELSFSANDAFIGEDGSDNVVEDISFKVDVQGLSISLQYLLAIDSEAFAGLELGQFLYISETQVVGIAPSAGTCIALAAVDDGVTLNTFTIDAGELFNVDFATAEANIITTEVENVSEDIVGILFEFYEAALPNICQNCLRTELNEVLKTTLDDAKATPEICQNEFITNETLVSAHEANPYFSFANSPSIVSFQNTLSEFLYVNDYSLLNSIFSGITATRVFTEPIGVDDFPLFYQDISYGSFGFSIGNLLINGLVFEELELFAPLQWDDPSRTQYETRTSFNISGPVEIEFDLFLYFSDLFVDFPSEEGGFTNEFQISISLDEIDFLLDLFLQVDILNLLRSPIGTITTLQQLPCILNSVSALQIQDIHFLLSNLELSATCVGTCQATVLFDDFSFEEGESLSTVFNDVVSVLLDFLSSEQFQQIVDDTLAGSEASCDELLCLLSGECFENIFDENNVFTIYLVSLFGTITLAALALYRIGSQHKDRKPDLIAQVKKEVKARGGSREEYKIQLEILDRNTDALYEQKAVPAIVKYLVPALCLLNIAIQVIAVGFSQAINYSLFLTVFGSQTREIVVAPITLHGLIEDLWSTGSYLLPIGILAASLTWPVVKNALLFVIWFTPATVLTTRDTTSEAGSDRRYSALQAIDFLGKLSFIEALFLIIIGAMIFTDIDLANTQGLTFLPPEFISVLVLSTLQRGTALLLYSAVSSLILNHIISYYHRKVLSANNVEKENLNDRLSALAGVNYVKPRKDKVQRLSKHGFKSLQPLASGTKTFRYSRLKMSVLQGFSAFVSVLLIISLVLPVIEIRITGVLGLALDIFQGSRVRSFGIISFGTLLSAGNSVLAVSQLMISIFAQSIYFLTVLGCPILQIPIGMVLLHAKLTLKSAENLFFLFQLCFYWSVLELTVFAGLGVLLQGSEVLVYGADIATFDLCSNIQSLLVAFLGEVDGKCLDAEVTFGFGTALFLVALMIYFGITITTYVLAKASLKDRYFQLYQNRRRDATPYNPSKYSKPILAFFLNGPFKPLDVNDDKESGTKNPLVAKTPVQTPGLLQINPTLPRRSRRTSSVALLESFRGSQKPKLRNSYSTHMARLRNISQQSIEF